MTQLNQIYKCDVCGNIVEVVHPAAGALVCCNKEMILQEENVQDAVIEKHIPVVEQTEKGYTVTVGSVSHPMGEDHYIEWIELLVNGKVLRKNLEVGDEPRAEFCTKANGATARAYCNLHGLWKK